MKHNSGLDCCAKKTLSSAREQKGSDLEKILEDVAEESTENSWVLFIKSPFFLSVLPTKNIVEP